MPQKTSYAHLAQKWTDKHRKRATRLLNTHKETISNASEKAKRAVVGTSAGLLLLASPTPLLQLPQLPSLAQEELIGKEAFLVTDLKEALPDSIGTLTLDQEKNISEILARYTGITAKAELEGKRLNRSYGYIGAEQHLARFPGDNENIHFDSPEDAEKYMSSGLAPGLGAYGYFARTQMDMTEEDNLREKYYIAVQTFLSEDFGTRFRDYMEFYKYRKMLVVNPHNGHAIVTDIADSGPAQWTGKQLGGSPEVMKYLQRQDGKARGPVLYFFIDDPENKIPLGPVKLVE